MHKKIQIAWILVLALCMIAAALTLVACNNAEHTHTFGEWNETPATCLEDGERTRRCTECGEVESEPIEALGHDWQEIAEITPATCEEEGLRSAVCSRCDAHEEEQIIPALGHDWKTETQQSETCQHGGVYVSTCQRLDCQATETKTTSSVGHKWGNAVTVAATCEDKGSITYTCTFGCGTKKIDTTNSLGHQWGSWTRVVEPDCTNKGSEKHTCTRSGCNKSETRSVDELGHSWSSGYIVDQEPTLEEAGSKSKHCTRNGCNAKNDVQPIPKLDADTPIEYTVTITDPCGEWYYGAATIGFYLDNKLVTEVPMSDSRVTKVTLGANNYNVRLSGLTEGYFAQEQQYEIFATEPQLTICLGAAMLSGTASGNYAVGSVMYDYSIDYYVNPDAEKQTTMLSDILKNKKGILINFYFKGCQPCANEMPSLVSVANTYMNDIQVLMVNECIRNSSDDDVKYFQRTYANNSPLWFVTIARSRFMYNRFINIIGGFPTTVLIDCNGQVVYSHSNQMSVTGFSSIINTYIINRYNKLHPSEQTQKITVDSYEVILPSNKFQLSE